MLKSNNFIVTTLAAIKVEGLFSISAPWQDVIDVKKWFTRHNIDGTTNIKCALGFQSK